MAAQLAFAVALAAFAAVLLVSAAPAAPLAPAEPAEPATPPMADAPSTPAAPAVGEVAAIRKFRVDDFLLGREIPCTAAQKQCLESGLIHNEHDGKCYHVAARKPCRDGGIFVVDKSQAINGTGRFRGVCVKEAVCPDPLVTPLAYDGSCRTLKEVISICSKEERLHPVRNIFGETECECDVPNCSNRPIGALQPKAEGRCVLHYSRDEVNSVYQRYREDGDHSGREIPCSEAEKACLRKGQLLNEEDGRCYRVGERGPCPVGLFFIVDKREALEGSGRFRGRCANASPCPEEGYERMAYDGSCRTHEEVDVICSALSGGSPAENIFGETVCECVSCYRGIFKGDQPEQEGRCLLTDLRHSNLPRLPFDGLQDEVPCTETERLCFLDDRIYYAEEDSCFELRRAEPCGEDHWLVADREEALNGSGHLVAGCRQRPCPPGEVLMLYDGRCHAERAVTRKVCSGRPIVFDAYGGAACGDGDEREQLPGRLASPGRCVYGVLGGGGFGGGAVGHLPPPNCPTADGGSCPRDVVAPEVTPDLF